MAITVPSDFLSNIVRKELADTVSPYLWSDDELYEYMNEVQRDFAIETHCIPDTYTDIPYTLNDGWIELDPEIIDVRRAVSGSGRVLTVTTLEDFSASYWEDDYGLRRGGAWEDATGEPRYLLTDLDAEQSRLYPIPITADTLSIYIWREPLSTLDADSVCFEIPKKYIYKLIYGIKMLAYSKQDFETFDGDKRTENRILWNETVRDAQSKVKKRARKPRSISYGGL